MKNIKTKTKPQTRKPNAKRARVRARRAPSQLCVLALLTTLLVAVGDTATRATILEAIVRVTAR